MFSKTIFTDGALAGLAATAGMLAFMAVVASLGGDVFGRHLYLALTGWYALFFIGAFWRYRKQRNANRFSAYEGILLGFTLNLSTAILTSGLLYLYTVTIDNSLVERNRQAKIDYIDRFRENQEAYNELLKRQEEGSQDPEKFYKLMVDEVNAQSDWWIIQWAGWQIAFFGLIHTLLFMLFFKT